MVQLGQKVTQEEKQIVREQGRCTITPCHTSSHHINHQHPHSCSHVSPASSRTTVPTIPIWILWNPNIWNPSGFYNTLKVYDDIVPFLNARINDQNKETQVRALVSVFILCNCKNITHFFLQFTCLVNVRFVLVSYVISKKISGVKSNENNAKKCFLYACKECETNVQLFIQMHNLCIQVQVFCLIEGMK